jgi:putative N6-adenine-specific DNA methylase
MTNLEKRIKRHVIGRTLEFFAATTPGLEKLCLKELKQLPFTCEEATVVPGGVEFKGRLHDCYAANLKLRLANRILMRISTFNATNFRKLQKKIAEIPWELYLLPDCALKINVNSSHSRLYHKRAISEHVQKEIQDRLHQFAAQPASMPVSTPAREQQVFIRIVNDHVMVSLDSSGALLYRRGLKNQSAVAPLRESIAAAVLRLARFTEKEPLIDPMCGSGTFSLEAAMMVRNIPPGWFREFAFMDWPSFRPTRWAYIKGQCEKKFTDITIPRIFAFDIDENACASLQDRIEHYGLSPAIQVGRNDFFHISPADFTDQTGLVVLNPPYGIRVGDQKTIEQFFVKICEKLKNTYTGWKFALIVPERRLLKKVPFKTVTHHPLYHGGLNLTLLTGSI